LLKAAARSLVNNFIIPPATVSTAWPNTLRTFSRTSTIQPWAKQSLFPRSQKLADEAGSYRATNVVMLGAMSRLTAIEPEIFAKAIDLVFPEKLRAVNHKAFQSGSDIIKYKCEF
jgi:Pyruvate/2-oxoacid:ferredoxin oxidoreductase gamma subunit